MLEKLIPTTYAQALNTARNTATAGKDIAVEKGNEGIQGFFKFIFNNIDNWIAGLIIVFASYIIAKMVAGAAKEKIIKAKGEDVQEGVLILVERMSKIIIIGLGVTIAFAINGLNFTAVIGALSLGIGFALKDIIGNFISSVILLAQDRFRIGDFVKVKDILGTIVSIDTRVTILQAIDGTEVVIPNQTMLNETIISYSINPFRRVDLPVGVDYKTNLPMVTTLIKGIIDKDPRIVPKPESTVLIDEFGDSSINLIARFWVESNANWLDIRSNLAHRIKKAFDEVGVNIPFPIRTLKLDENDRSFLKTIDSMKKGFVPEPATIPTDEIITQAASNTEDAVHVPKALFKKSPPPKPEEKYEDLIKAVDQTETKEAPQPQSQPTEKVNSAPPTHL
jgi:small conductance mechanosensitive channel